MAGTIYFHIGFHKTGSTTLQTFLHEHEAALHDQDLYIPRACRQRRRTIIHSNLSWDILGSDSFDPELGTAQDLVEEVRTCGAKQVLVTDEGLSRLKTPAPLLDLFPEREKVIIAYTREPFGAAASFYSENLKFGTTKTFEAWLDTQGRTFADHDRLLNRWRHPDVALRTERIDGVSSRGADLVAHFCGLIGVSAPATVSRPNNSRISYQEALALFFCNNVLQALTADLAPPHRERLHRNIRRTVREEMKRYLVPYGLTEVETHRIQEMFGAAEAPAPRPTSDFAVPEAARTRLKEIVRDAVFDEVIVPKTAPMEAFQPAPDGGER